MIYLALVIFQILSAVFAIKIGIYYEDKKRKRVMKNMYEFWNDEQDY